MNGWRWILVLLRRLPQGALSRGWGRLAELRLPGPLQRRVNRVFARLFGIDTDEAEKPPEAYPSLAAYFVRNLRPGVRTWPENGQIPCSPVDGILGTFGPLVAGTAIQAKGICYRVSDLLGEGFGQGGHESLGVRDGMGALDGMGARDATGALSEGESRPTPSDFQSGCFFTIYLSPRHYHRIHAPVSGGLNEARSIPGRLLPVNLAAVTTVTDLFPRNERLVALMDRVAIVAIGAFNVGRISAAFDPHWGGSPEAGVTNRSGRALPESRIYQPPIRVVRGSEIMAFHFGSTVVLLFEGRAVESWRISTDLREGREVQVGLPLFEKITGDA